MNAGDVMTTGAAMVRPDQSLAETGRILVEHRISGLPVVDANGRLVGVVTEHDFLRQTMAAALVPVPAERLIRSRLVSCTTAMLKM